VPTCTRAGTNRINRIQISKIEFNAQEQEQFNAHQGRYCVCSLARIWPNEKPEAGKKGWEGQIVRDDRVDHKNWVVSFKGEHQLSFHT